MSDNPTKDGEITIEELKKGAKDVFYEILEENIRKKKKIEEERRKQNEQLMLYLGIKEKK